MQLRLLERRLKVLANEQRLHMLQELKRRRGSDVTSLARALNLSIQATSAHLQKLAALDIVTVRKRGRTVFYRLSLRQNQPVKYLLTIL